MRFFLLLCVCLLWSTLSANKTIVDQFHKALPSLYSSKASFDDACNDVRHDKFLLYEASHGWQQCAGLSHLNLSLSCALSEASHMKRVLLVPDRLCVLPLHNNGIVIQDPPVERYWNLSHLGCVQTWSTFLRSRGVMSDTPLPFGDRRAFQNLSLHAFDVWSESGQFKDEIFNDTMRLATNSEYAFSDVLVRSNFGTHFGANYRFWFFVCGHHASESVHLAAPLPHFYDETAQAIVDEIGEPFVLVKVRRGDKALLWKDHERATRERAVRNRLLRCVPRGHAVYIATDETNPDYFAALTNDYQVYQAHNFTRLLRKHLEPERRDSEYEHAAQDRLLFASQVDKNFKFDKKVWSKLPKQLRDGAPVVLDNYALYLVELTLQKHAVRVMCTEHGRCDVHQPTLLPDSGKVTHDHKCDWVLRHGEPGR